jgi:iron complex transport system substrate-binding protein
MSKNVYPHTNIAVCICFLFVFTCFSCDSQKEQTQTTQKIIPKYAKGFFTEYVNGYKILTVRQTWKNAKGNTTKPIRYLLLKAGQSEPQGFSDVIKVRVPIRKIVCLSTTHAPLIDLLGESEKIVGFSGSKYISNLTIRKQINLGKIQEIGQENGINVELVLNLQPDVVMAYSMSERDNSYQQLLRAGLVVALNSEYLEETPLGMAEWLKFAAAFFDKEAQADSIFSEIEKTYIETTQLVKNQANKPSVFLNIPYGSTWYMAGGRSFAAKLLLDAGANYVLAMDTTNGSTPMSIETVFQYAHKADFWLNVSDFKTIQALRNADSRFVEFEAMKKGNIFNNNKKTNENGGVEYWELGVVRPDMVLKDLVKIFHPTVLPQHESYFYQKLE